MTAVRAFVVETKADKLERLTTEWLQEAVGYMFTLKMYDGVDPQEISQAYELAETLWENSDNAGLSFEDWLTPEEAVDEELSYWGD
jgi:hypothetical protein